MKHMSRRQSAAYRRQLEDLRWMLTREYWKGREGGREQDRESAEDLVDLAVRSYAREFLMSLSEIEREQLFLIEEALARIDEGVYGTCDECRCAIPETRLDAIPWTRLCIHCQGLQEQGVVSRPAVSVRCTA